MLYLSCILLFMMGGFSFKDLDMNYEKVLMFSFALVWVQVSRGSLVF